MIFREFLCEERTSLTDEGKKNQSMEYSLKNNRLGKHASRRVLTKSKKRDENSQEKKRRWKLIIISRCAAGSVTLHARSNQHRFPLRELPIGWRESCSPPGRCRVGSDVGTCVEFIPRRRSLHRRATWYVSRSYATNSIHRRSGRYSRRADSARPRPWLWIKARGIPMNNRARSSAMWMATKWSRPSDCIQVAVSNYDVCTTKQSTTSRKHGSRQKREK